MKKNKFSLKKTLLITLIVYVIYLAIIIPTLSCPGVVRYCEATFDEEVQGDEIQIFSSGARTIPLSCMQVCTDEEYVYAYIENILVRFLGPLILIFAVVYMIPKLKWERKTS